jgi:phosphate starvation-inducible PhoH-like protein
MGPAGSGKTYLPTAQGLDWLRHDSIRKLILTRPLVTCSASNRDALGILPGEMNEKVGPYLRPLLDVLMERAGQSEVEALLRQGRVEMVPLDVMRGLSFKESLIVADEMQNATLAQLRMLATRFGASCRLIISGDPSQSDLTHDTPALVEAFHRLGGHKEVGRVILRKADVVRHPLVSWVDDRLGSQDGDFTRRDSEAWYCVTCPWCDGANWFRDGSEDGVNCWVCRRDFALDDEGEPLAQPPCGLTFLGQRRAG